MAQARASPATAPEQPSSEPLAAPAERPLTAPERAAILPALSVRLPKDISPHSEGGESVPQIFPKSANKWPLHALGGLAAVAVVAPLFLLYYFSPEYTDVGYQPEQPVPFSHKLHAGELELDCRYCHAQVEIAAVASVPPAQVCMTCHSLVATAASSPAAT